MALDDLSGGFTDNVPNGAAFIKGSILDEKLILFEKYSFGYAYHVAAYAAEGLSASPKIPTVSQNWPLSRSSISTTKCSPRLHHLPPHNVYGERQNIGDR